MVGGGMRQIGIVAAAGLYALRNNIDRLDDDHTNAKRLADGLSALDGIAVDLDTVESNMVFIKPAKGTGDALRRHLAASNIVTGSYDEQGDASLRLVTHLDIDSDDIDKVVEAFAAFADHR